MGQRGLQVHLYRCNRDFLWSRDWEVAIFAPLRLVTTKSLRGTQTLSACSRGMNIKLVFKSTDTEKAYPMP